MTEYEIAVLASTVATITADDPEEAREIAVDQFGSGRSRWSVIGLDIEAEMVDGEWVEWTDGDDDA